MNEVSNKDSYKHEHISYPWSIALPSFNHWRWRHRLAVSELHKPGEDEGHKESFSWNSIQMSCKIVSWIARSFRPRMRKLEMSVMIKGLNLFGFIWEWARADNWAVPGMPGLGPPARYGGPVPYLCRARVGPYYF